MKYLKIVVRYQEYIGGTELHRESKRRAVYRVSELVLLMEQREDD